jgi:nicotinamidase/pyrazinamidase
MQTQSHHVALIVVDVQNGFTPGGIWPLQKQIKLFRLLINLQKSLSISC